MLVRDEDLNPSGNEATELASGSPGADEGGDARLPAGAQAGDYRVARFVGAGAMGDVYEGEQPVIGKRVAIKVIKRALASSEEALERFTREARAVNKIDCANVLDVFAFGRLDDGRLYLVMDLLEGESLGQRLERAGAIPIEQLLEILEPVCTALDAAHGEGIVHRDLKPDNVFLAGGDDGPPRVYVLDFGIAKMIHDEAASRGAASLTGEGSWMGTPLYMAPEQWSNDEVTPSSDIYALGAMTFQMITGAAPFKASSLPGLMEKHFHAEMPPLATGAGPSVPPGLDAALARALAKRPEDRFASAGAFLAAVTEAIGAASQRHGPRAAAAATARPTFRPFRAAEPDSPAPMRRGALAALIAALAVAAVAATAFFALRGDRDGESAAPAEPVSVAVTSDPKGAVVYCNDRKFGVTPTTVEIAKHAHGLLRLTKPGYETVETEIAPDTHDIVAIDLTPIAGFEGTWKRPDGTLRVFKRKGERVAGYEVASVGDEPRFLHFFEFTPAEQDGVVVFGAVKDFVDSRADNEISCHIPLHAEYRYLTDGDRLEQRLEEVSYDYKDSRCLNPVKAWTPFEPLERLAHASTRTHAVSEAGAAPIQNAEPPPQAPEIEKKSKPKRKKAQSKKPKFEDSNRVPRDVQIEQQQQKAEPQLAPQQPK